MKHIFHIHSNINLVSALGIIDYKALSKDDVILSVCRNINVSYLEYQVLYIPDIIYYHSYNKLSTLRNLDWLCNRKIIAILDDFIKDVNDSNYFIYYCPNSRNFHNRVFITNKNCKGVEYVEDGMDAYLEENLYYKKYPFELRKKHLLAQKFLFKWFNAFCYNRLEQEDDPFKSYYGHEAKIYCISEKAYSFRNEVCVLPLDKIAKNTKLEDDTINDNDHIFILDAVVEQEVVPLDIYKSFIKYFITIFGNKSLKIKFHPFQEENLKEWTLNEFKENSIHVTEVKEEMPFELILLCKNNLTIYGIGSSLLLYSSYIGNHKTNIHYPFFEDKLGYQSSRLPYWKSAFKEL